MGSRLLLRPRARSGGGEEASITTALSQQRWSASAADGWPFQHAKCMRSAPSRAEQVRRESALEAAQALEAAGARRRSERHIVSIVGEREQERYAIDPEEALCLVVGTQDELVLARGRVDRELETALRPAPS